MATIRSRKRPFVVAVSGTSGAGKSTLARQAAHALGATALLFFDDHVTVANNPAAIGRWLAAGAKPNAFKTPGLTAALRQLLRERQFEGGPLNYVLMEDPFGRSRSSTSRLIDMVAYLDLPLEIALARRVIRTIEERQRPPEAQLAHLHADLKTFLAGGRLAYLAASGAARASADLVMDGTRPLDELVGELTAEIRRRSAK